MPSLPRRRARLGRLLILVRFPEGFDVFEQVVQLVFYDAPHDPVVNGIVAVQEDIPEGDDIAMLADASKKSRFVPLNSVQRLAHDLELPFDGAAELVGGGVLFEGLFRDEYLDSPRRLKNVVKMGKHLILTRGTPSPAPP